MDHINISQLLSLLVLSLLLTLLIIITFIGYHYHVLSFFIIIIIIAKVNSHQSGMAQKWPLVDNIQRQFPCKLNLVNL